MKLGIVGLPNVGKSTLFKALTKANVEIANYPFCTIDPNIAVVPVPDSRLEHLCEVYNPDKCIPAVLEVADIAGLVPGASRGEGLGNKFLGNIREVDAIIHLVRCFEDPDVAHVDGSIDPIRDVESINLELIFADLEHLQKRIDKISRQAKGGDKKLLGELDYMRNLQAHLESGLPARSFPEIEQYPDLSLLTAKPVLYVANVAESEINADSPQLDKIREIADAEGAELIAISAETEAEISELDDEERDYFLEELELPASGLERIIRSGYKLLELISFFTFTVPKEVRAWTIKAGTKAPQAAGAIHSDFERGFIRAEATSFDDFISCDSSMAAVKEKGKYRSEGKEYLVHDGDIILFRFNV